MIRNIKKLFDASFAQDRDDPPSEEALRLAAAALLFEVSRADFDIHDAELAPIEELITQHFQVPPDEAELLLKLAHERAEQATSLHDFTSLINAHWTPAQRLQLIEFMWRVAYADTRLDDHELHLMRKIGRLLYIPHRQFINAKLRAKSAAQVAQ